jgi:hypothetical protein
MIVWLDIVLDLAKGMMQSCSVLLGLFVAYFRFVVACTGLLFGPFGEEPLLSSSPLFEDRWKHTGKQHNENYGTLRREQS